MLAWFIFLSAMLLGIGFFTNLETAPRQQWESFLSDQQNSESFSVLVQSPGVPANWSADNPPFVVGISDAPFVLSSQKLESFSDWFDADENALKQAMGFNRSQSIRLKISQLGGEELFSAGNTAPVSAVIARYQSFALLSGESCLVQLEVWNA